MLRHCPTHFHVAKLAISTSQRGFAVRSLLPLRIGAPLDCCGDHHRDLRGMSRWTGRTEVNPLRSKLNETVNLFRNSRDERD
jgi:hypothetical protein